MVTVSKRADEVVTLERFADGAHVLTVTRVRRRDWTGKVPHRSGSVRIRVQHPSGRRTWRTFMPHARVRMIADVLPLDEG